MAESEHPYCRCLFYAANALARTITRLAEEAFAPTGLAPSPAFVLMTVHRQPGVQPSEIAAITMLSPSTVTRLVEKLEAKGLLRRESCGKATHIELTEAGQALGPVLQEAWAATQARTAGLLGEKACALTEHVYAAARVLEGG